MPFKYEEVVPWGRSHEEYLRMFDLGENELRLKILGCGDGPASFNCEGNEHGGDITSVDPIYRLSKASIQDRIRTTYQDVLEQTYRNREKFRWDDIPSVEALGKIRMRAMDIFLESYDRGRLCGRYVPGELPNLPFSDRSFDLALCSHLLFLYTENLSYDFHAAALREMLRVAREVRIFPILDMNGSQSPYVEKIRKDFHANSIDVRAVDYEFQIGGDKVLVVR